VTNQCLITGTQATVAMLELESPKKGTRGFYKIGVVPGALCLVLCAWCVVPTVHCSLFTVLVVAEAFFFWV
jgi:hypothetical protein